MNKRSYIKSIESPIYIYTLWHITNCDWSYFDVTRKPKYGIGEQHLTSEDTEPEALEAIADAYLIDCQEAY